VDLGGKVVEKEKHEERCPRGLIKVEEGGGQRSGFQGWEQERTGPTLDGGDCSKKKRTEGWTKKMGDDRGKGGFGGQRQLGAHQRGGKSEGAGRGVKKRKERKSPILKVKDQEMLKIVKVFGCKGETRKGGK